MAAAAAELTCPTPYLIHQPQRSSTSLSCCINAVALTKTWTRKTTTTTSTSTKPLKSKFNTRSNRGRPIMNLTTPSTFSSKLSTDIPLYEAPGASFDQYLEDKPRVFKAIFPDKRRSERLNEEDWRIQMLPIQFLFLTAWPVIDMRLKCKSEGTNYPPGVPREISKVLELNIIKWELKGLDDVLKPSQFSLGVKGALYPDRRGRRSRLKGQLEMSISFILPPTLQLVPQDILQNVSEAVLKNLVENMKQKVNSSLLADYSEFRKTKARILVVNDQIKSPH